MFARYADEQGVMTWDIMNEPEFDVWDGKASADDVRALLATITSSAHSVSSRLVSVGGARLDGLALLLGLGLDYYTIHWYDPMTNPDECLACVTYADIRDTFGISEPVLVGEYYAGTAVGGRYDLWYSHGYAGALGWSLLPDRTADGLDVDLAEALVFAERVGLA